MSDDLLQSVSQGLFDAQDAENSRIEALANEIHRRCQLYEAQCGDSQPNVDVFGVEQRIAEVYAKENNLWLPVDNVFDLGVPGPSGNENDTYVSQDITHFVLHIL